MKRNFLTRKEEIVLSTISLIHEMGVSNVSMKEIGRREGVTEASLYKHFKSKEELLGAVMEYYEQYDSHIYKTLENSSDSATDNIFRYFEIYAQYYSNYKEVTSLTDAYSVLAYDVSFAERTNALIRHKMEFMENLVKRGQDEGNLKRGIEAENISYMLLGSFDRIIAVWQMKQYSFSLAEKTKEVVGDIVKAFGTGV